MCSHTRNLYQWSRGHLQTKKKGRSASYYVAREFTERYDISKGIWLHNKYEISKGTWLHNKYEIPKGTQIKWVFCARQLNFPNTSYPNTIPCMCFLSPQEQDCLLSVSLLRPNDLWPEVLQKFPILSFYVRSLMKWHTVSVNIPRGSYYKRKIYMNRLYISLSYLPYNPNIMPYNLWFNQCTNYTCTIQPIFP